VVRFHLDEHVSHHVARGLRSRGVDVTTATNARLLGADDAAHLAFACSQNRVVFTHDRDFLRLARNGTTHFGIVFCSHGSRSIGHIVRLLCLMDECLSEEETKGRVEFI
jgi:predicted nuclease of predicted toxin-antitoxin system